ncbi:MAG: hypothetical protein RSD49_13020 [Hafnia sp.]
MATMYIRNARDIFIVSFMTLALSGCERPDSANSKIAYVDVAKAISDSSIGLQEESRNLKVRNILLKAEAGANEKYKMMSEKKSNRVVILIILRSIKYGLLNSNVAVT